ncbi:hypothetical protein CLU79DRAFT_58792 [Phycomyces nitens]|nr:hypothetical protein CLU79DRAFT_58792 [Phycomyces nitens]
MNFNFEGNYRAKRSINLGGVKANDDKRSLMLKAQTERKARELERKRLYSASLIQAFYRGRKEAAYLHKCQRSSFQNILASLRGLLQEQNPKDYELADLVEQVMRYFCQYFI